MGFSRLFSAEGDFAATRQAEAFLQRAGFSVGHSERGSPRGILFGDFDIQKWRNLRASDRAALHGQMTGDGRHGPIRIRFVDRLPDDAVRALERALKAEAVSV